MGEGVWITTATPSFGAHQEVVAEKFEICAQTEHDILGNDESVNNRKINLEFALLPSLTVYLCVCTSVCECVFPVSYFAHYVGRTF